MVTTGACVPRGTRAVSAPVHLADEERPGSCCCLHCCVETSHGSRSLGGVAVVLSGCEDQSSQVVEHQRKATLAVFFAVSAPSSCSAVGVSVAAGFSLSLCFKSALH